MNDSTPTPDPPAAGSPARRRPSLLVSAVALFLLGVTLTLGALSMFRAWVVNTGQINIGPVYVVSRGVIWHASEPRFFFLRPDRVQSFPPEIVGGMLDNARAKATLRWHFMGLEKLDCPAPTSPTFVHWNGIPLWPPAVLLTAALVWQAVQTRRLKRSFTF